MRSAPSAPFAVTVTRITAEGKAECLEITGAVASTMGTIAQVASDEAKRLSLDEAKRLGLDEGKRLEELHAEGIRFVDLMKPDDRDPPKIAEFLLTALLKPSRADAVTGDLNEHFARDCKKLGRHRAVWLYWARTLQSLWPLLRRAIGKALKWGAVIWLSRR